jgi:hypothetical protein
MSSSKSPEPGIWQQLRRRRVTRTVVTYLAAAFSVFEATWYAVPRFGLVEDVTRLVLGVLVLGFPLAVVLAWTYDLTPAGLVRTPDDASGEPAEATPQLGRSAWLLVVVALAAVGFAFRSLRM